MMAGYRPLRCDVLDVQLTRELNEPHFDIVGLGDTAGGRHHAFQSCGISRYEGRIVSGSQLCVSHDFAAGIVDIGNDPKLIDPLNAVRRRHLEIDLKFRGRQT